MKVPEIYIPLIEKNLFKFAHDTGYYIFPPGTIVELYWGPDKGKVYYVFGLTFGKPRDYNTQEVVYSDDFYFWHRHSQMDWHYDPCIESIADIEYPHHLKVVKDDPMHLEFHNDTDRTMVMDISVWMFIANERSISEIDGYFDRLYLEGLPSVGK